jgi:hypothetical protein
MDIKVQDETIITKKLNVRALSFKNLTMDMKNIIEEESLYEIVVIKGA